MLTLEVRLVLLDEEIRDGETVLDAARRILDHPGWTHVVRIRSTSRGLV